MSYTYKYPRPSVTVDLVIFTIAENDLKVLLIRRNGQPFKDNWALPGGFVEIDESLEKAAARELKEEAGVTKVYLEQLYTFGDPKRDPRGRVISVSYFALVDAEQQKIRALTDTIAGNLGIRPQVYKAGRYGIGPHTAGILIDEGYKVDLSVFPTREYVDQGGPDFRDFDAWPFWLDRERRLLELPFTTAFTGALRANGPALSRVTNTPAGRFFRLPGALARFGLLNQINLTPEGVTLA